MYLQEADVHKVNLSLRYVDNRLSVIVNDGNEYLGFKMFRHHWAGLTIFHCNLWNRKMTYSFQCVLHCRLFLLHFSVSVVLMFSWYRWCVPSVYVCNADLVSLNRFMTFKQRKLLLPLFLHLWNINMAL